MQRIVSFLGNVSIPTDSNHCSLFHQAKIVLNGTYLKQMSIDALHYSDTRIPHNIRLSQFFRTECKYLITCDPSPLLFHQGIPGNIAVAFVFEFTVRF